MMFLYPPYYPPSMYVIGQYAYFFDDDNTAIRIFRYHLTTKTFEIIYHAPPSGDFFFAADLIILENEGDGYLLASLSVFNPQTNRWQELFV